MDTQEKIQLEKSLHIHRKFLRGIYSVSHSRFKLRDQIGKARIAQLRILLAILRATAKGDIPMKKHHFQEISATRNFPKVVGLKDHLFYKKVRAFDREGLVEFILKHLTVWKLYLYPLFNLS